MAPLTTSRNMNENGYVEANNNNNVDRISNLPVVLTDNIIQRLPISEIGKMSVLSKYWQNYWSCIRSLRFDCENNQKFFKIEEYSSIITNIMFVHQGPIHEFILRTHPFPSTIELSRWLRFLSRNGVKNITLHNKSWSKVPVMHSHIYLCQELEQLELCYFILNPPLDEFKGFVHIRKLKLNTISFRGDRLISSCLNLATLKIQDCTGDVIHLVIDAPRLEKLILLGEFGSIVLKNVPKLSRLRLSLVDNNNLSSIQAVDVIKNVASSCKLKELNLGRNLFKIWSVGGLRKYLPLSFTNLTKLDLWSLDLDDSGAYICTFGLLQSCRFIEKLSIFVCASKNGDVQDKKFAYDNNYKLDHLREVTFQGLGASRAELQLVEYVLNVSTVLQNFFITFERLNDSSDREMQRELIRFQRASPKARVVIS